MISSASCAAGMQSDMDFQRDFLHTSGSAPARFFFYDLNTTTGGVSDNRILDKYPYMLEIRR
jgi:hypothetical protein